MGKIAGGGDLLDFINPQSEVKVPRRKRVLDGERRLTDKKVSTKSHRRGQFWKLDLMRVNNWNWNRFGA